ncbi:MAG: hydrolase [Candidatus Saccharibacteria bacterium]|nr:hydrolase [Candidatus Saccharibacteria bacterium]
MNTRRIATRGIIFRDGKLLVAKFIHGDGSESKYWGTFGGGLDFGETLTDGLHREMIEETGIKAKIGKLLFIQQFKDDDKENLEFFFHIENPEDYEDIKFEDTTHGHIEMSQHEFVDPATHPVLPAFLQTIDIADYIENDRPVFIWNEYTPFK